MILPSVVMELTTTKKQCEKNKRSLDAWFDFFDIKDKLDFFDIKNRHVIQLYFYK